MEKRLRYDALNNFLRLEELHFGHEVVIPDETGQPDMGTLPSRRQCLHTFREIIS